MVCVWCVCGVCVVCVWCVCGVWCVWCVWCVEDARLRPIRLRPTGRNRICRSRNWPKSNLAEVEIGRSRTDDVCSFPAFSISSCSFSSSSCYPFSSFSSCSSCSFVLLPFLLLLLHLRFPVVVPKHFNPEP